jgi:hypothetical protein
VRSERGAPGGDRILKLEPGSGGLAGGPRDLAEKRAGGGERAGWTPYALSHALYQPRYLSNSGRLFFNSADALVPQDVNAFEVSGVGFGRVAVGWCGVCGW